MSTFKTSRTADEVLKAIKASGGVKTTIAKRLNVTRQTIDNYLNRWSTVRQAYIDEKAGIDDLALSVVIEDITKKNVETAKWWISKKLDEFKPVQRLEIQVTWQDKVIEALRQGKLKPELVRQRWGDELAEQFFRQAGVNVESTG